MSSSRLSNLGFALAAALALLFAPDLRAQLSLSNNKGAGALSFGTTTFNNGLGFGARAMGMAGAFTAIADDASAGSWNPAGLGQLIKPELTVVGGYNKATVTTSNETARILSTDTDTTFLFLKSVDREVDAKSQGVDFVSFVLPLKVGRQLFTTQISYNRNARPLDTDDSIRVDFFDKPGGTDLGPDFYDTKVRSTGGYDSFGLGLGTGFDDRFFVGFTLNYWVGKTSTSIETHYQSFSRASSGALTKLTDWNLQTSDEQSYAGLSANVGVIWKPSPRFSLGLVYRGGWSGKDDYTSDYNQAGSDTFRVTNPSGQVTSQYLPFTAKGTATSNATLVWPSTLGGGLAWRPAEALTLAFDASITQWKHSYITRVPVATFGRCTLTSGVVTCPVLFNEPAVRFPSQAFTDSVQQNDQIAYRVGVEYVLRPGSLILPIRAGAYKIKTIAPIYDVGDTDPGVFFTGFTAGLGLAIPIGRGSLLFDVAGVFDKASTSRSGSLALDPEAPSLVVVQTGDREVKNTRVIGSLIYRF